MSGDPMPWWEGPLGAAVTALFVLAMTAALILSPDAGCSITSTDTTPTTTTTTAAR